MLFLDINACLLAITLWKIFLSAEATRGQSYRNRAGQTHPLSNSRTKELLRYQRVQSCLHYAFFDLKKWAFVALTGNDNKQVLR
jgi:hypothetical protein